MYEKTEGKDQIFVGACFESSVLKLKEDYSYDKKNRKEKMFGARDIGV